MVNARVHWLPYEVTNEEVFKVFESHGDVKSITHVMEDAIATGVREVVYSMKEGEQRHPLT